jgi:Leucine-rich repeat (LRR) protein
LTNNTVTWLHLSDLHAYPAKTGWDANHVIKSLVEDLKELQRDYELRPDLVFFTGDAAFGQVSDRPGESLQDQYKAVQHFLDEVRRAFRPELNSRDLYLVPGNHDVNRQDIDETQTAWLRDSTRTLPDVVSMMQAGTIQWRRFMERLEDYKLFLKTNGYEHLLTDDKNRLIYADEREVAGLRIGIAGLNSAWSCYGGDEDKARLWCGGKYQVEELRSLLSKADFSIALIHHPGNWFVAQEDPNVQRLLEASFQFVLHGHEHQEWVRTDSKTGHTVVWAGPCYEHSEKQNGFNMVRLDRKTGEGSIWFREYRETGRGWVAHNIKSFAPQGVWTLDGMKWFQGFRLSEIREEKKPPPKNGKKAHISRSMAATAIAAQTLARTGAFERRFCEAIVRKYDYLELFGADIPRESQRHSLSVAYVSLNLSEDEGEKIGDGIPPRIRKTQAAESKLGFIGARPVADVFDHLGGALGRLLIRGAAGGGKSTLLRWAAIESGKFNLECREALDSKSESEADSLATTLEDVRISNGKEDSSKANWRTRIPFLIRLRDCSNGSLPRPRDWPALIAKELPDPPSDWIDRVLTSGRGLILLDGVDEVPTQKREALAREIEDLVGAYPKNYWLVSTRPGAVDKGWLSQLDFLEARIEPMSLADQNEFIDKWYWAVAAELRSTARRAENLDKLSASLKQELKETPGIARLATYPLLCAMICALYRERNQRLPETQAALCEDLSKMLLHRRERETPDMSLIHLPPDYRKLDYEQKKYIVAELAKHMVDTGISSIDEDKADSLIGEALNHFPDHAHASAQEMRRAFVERSGILRPSGTDRIDFLHNTLKEYLAAGRFVAEDTYDLLATRADDDAWQPVILFAAALPTPGFASNLMRDLLARLPKPRRSKKRLSKPGALSRKTSARGRAREFFVVRCRNAAFRLDPRLVERVTLLAEGLFPPNTISDAEVLAELGEIVVPHLNPKQRAGARQKVACIRALRLIGGPKAKTVLKSFVPGKAKSVLAELIGAAAELKVSLRLAEDSLDLSFTSVSDLKPLSALIGLHSLNLAATRVKDLLPLGRLKALEDLNLSKTPVQDLSPLAKLKNLRFLDLTQATPDLTTLRGAKSLSGLRLSTPSYYRRSYDYRAARYRSSLDLRQIEQTLSVSHLGSQVVSRYHQYRGLRVLAHRRQHSKRVAQLIGAKLSPRQIIEIKPWLPLLAHLDHVLGPRGLTNELITSLPQSAKLLERVLYYDPHAVYSRMRREGFFPAGEFYRGEGDLRDLDQISTGDSLLLPLAVLKNLRVLDLSGAPVIDLTPLSNLPKLEVLMLRSTMATDLSPLSRLKELRWLELGDTFSTDLLGLAKLTKLRILDLSSTPVSDISFLAAMNNLEVLNLSDSEVRNVEPLLALPSLRYLFLFRRSRLDRMAPATLRTSLRLLKEANRRLEIFI